MQLAITVWNDRISPVFDVAEHLLVFELNDGEITEKRIISFKNSLVIDKIMQLTKLNVEILVCGAICQEVCSIISDHNIQLYTFRTGSVSKITEALINNELDDNKYAMPGCAVHHKICNLND